jgi:hypothetical protein
MRIVKIIQTAVCALMLCAILSPAIKADEWNKKTVVTFADAVQIPGQVLPAGTYVFKLANSSANRHIVEVWTGDQTQLITTVLTVADYRPDTPDKTVFEYDERPGDTPMAIHAWFFPGDHFGQEFVYPQL